MAWQNLPSTSTPINDTNLNSLSNSIIEGDWTPTISVLNETNPTVTYTRQLGTYKKIGNIVFYRFSIRAKITALNGTNNYAQISGLPYSSYNYGLSDFGETIGDLYNAIANDTNAIMCPTGNNIRIQNDYGVNAAKWVVTPTNYMEISGSGFYFTN